MRSLTLSSPNQSGHGRLTDEAIDGFHEALLHDDPVALYDKAPCGYLSTTPDGVIVKANETFLTLTGFARDELIGRVRFASLLTGGGRIYHETHYAPMLLMHGSVRGIALDIVCQDGARLPVLVNAVLECNANDEPVVIRTAVFGAAERRSYERELMRAKDDAERAERRATKLARTLQQTLIPPAPPAIPGLDVAAAYRPAGAGDEVGGDFYDVFQVDDDDWVVVVGDVQGKGAEAAVISALVRHNVRAAAVLEQEPAAILRSLNSVLLHDGVDRFCTIAIVRLIRIDDSSWRASIGLGGHSLPVLCRRAQVPRYIGEPGVLIGVWESAPSRDTVLILEPGDTLLLYTDGITEARNDDGFFGDKRLLDLAAIPTPDAAVLVDSVVSAAIAFQHGIPRDDIAVVAVGVPH